MQQIKSFGIVQTAKFFGVMYSAISAIFAIPVAIIGTLVSVMAGKPQGLLFPLVLLAPIAYGIITFIFTAFGCWAYNVIAQRIGGIEIELQ